MLCMIVALSVGANHYIVLQAADNYENINVLIDSAVDITDKDTYTGKFGDTMYESDGNYEANYGELIKIKLEARSVIEIDFGEDTSLYVPFDVDVYEEKNDKLVYSNHNQSSDSSLIIYNIATEEKYFYIWVKNLEDATQYNITVKKDFVNINELADSATYLEYGKVYSDKFKETEYFYFYYDAGDDRVDATKGELFKVKVKPGKSVAINYDRNHFITVVKNLNELGIRDYEQYGIYGTLVITNNSNKDEEYYVWLVSYYGGDNYTYELSCDEIAIPALSEMESKAISLQPGKKF